jgi:hypothetical protein
VDHKAWDEMCPVRISARGKLRTKLETRPYLYSVTVDLDRRPLVRPSQKAKAGHPRIGTSVVRDNEANQDTIDVEAGRENKGKRQSTLSFPTVEMETDPTPRQLGVSPFGRSTCTSFARTTGCPL